LAVSKAKQVLRETLEPALFGIAVQILSALVATRLIASMLFGISACSLPTIGGVFLSLLLVALIAGFLPDVGAGTVDVPLKLLLPARHGAWLKFIQSSDG
jgi:hypothetical protein